MVTPPAAGFLTRSAWRTSSSLGDSRQELVTGADIWEINANESVAFQYSRYNYNVTRFFNGGDPFEASDHNPEVVGLNATTSGVTELQLLGANDYHGRLLRNGAEGGAAILSGAALSFARAVGEIGSLVLITAKVPIASIVIYNDVEGDAPHAAASLSLVLMVVSLVVLALIRRLGGRVAH